MDSATPSPTPHRDILVLKWYDLAGAVGFVSLLVLMIGTN